MLPDHQLALHAAPQDATLTPGHFGILEPSPGWPLAAPNQIVAVLVPGLAFDRLGTRLGRGGGYYDRLLPTLPQARRIALCFSCQLFDQLPRQPHDALIHAILTERGLITC